MNPQAMVDWFAQLAKPRLMELLKLKSVEHLYDPTPGRAPSKFLHNGAEISLDKLWKTMQPYRDIDRFVSSERVQQYVIDPGLVPLVKSILVDTRGRRLLVTRKVAPKDAGESAVAHLDRFGMRILARYDPGLNETQIVWECLYGVS